MTEPTKYALVTGGSRGIGREICLKLARSGYYVLINYRSNADEAQRTLEGVRAADRLPQLERDFPVSEGGDFAVAELFAEPVADGLGQRQVGVPGEHLYLFSV